MAIKERTMYKPTHSDEIFLKMMRTFGAVRISAIPTIQQIKDVAPSLNNNSAKRWRYRLGMLPGALPYGDMTQQSAAEHLTAIAKDILHLDKAVNTPMTEDSEYFHKDDVNAKPKFTPDPVRKKPVEGVIDFDAELTDEDLKNLVLIDGKND
jgi:hypothetical protein